MPTLNYTTAVPAQRTVAQPQDLLAQKGAIDVQAICRGTGVPVGIRFSIDTRNGVMRFAMPVDIDRTYQVLTSQNVLPRDDQRRRKQAERVAWLKNDVYSGRVCVNYFGRVFPVPFPPSGTRSGNWARQIRVPRRDGRCGPPPPRWPSGWGRSCPIRRRPGSR